MTVKKKSDFDRFVDEIQEEILEEEREIYSETVIREYFNPRNVGRMENPDAFGIMQGPCSDTMEFYMKIHEGKIDEVTFMTDGCGATIACGSMLTSMVKGHSIDEAKNISPDDLITVLGGLPKESLHCAALAIGALRKAIRNFYKK